MPHRLLTPLLFTLAISVAVLHVGYHVKAQTPDDGSQATATATSVPTTTPSGAILASDDFSDPGKGLLPKSSAGTPQPDKIQRGYINGEYQLAKTDPDYSFLVVSAVQSTYTDTTVAADVRLVSPNSPGQQALIGCRRVAPSGTGYYMEIEPIGQSFYLFRFDGAGATSNLQTLNSLAAIHPGTATNHLELTCNGSTIAASINGTKVISVQDSTYQSGAIALLAGVFSGALPNTVDARFSNLVVTQP